MSSYATNFVPPGITGRYLRQGAAALIQSAYRAYLNRTTRPQRHRTTALRRLVRNGARRRVEVARAGRAARQSAARHTAATRIQRMYRSWNGTGPTRYYATPGSRYNPIMLTGPGRRGTRDNPIVL